jgi:hypothetical protein
MASVLPGPVLLGVAVCFLLGSIWPGLVVAAAGVAVLTRRPRRRGLAWTDQGLVVQRDAYRLLASWEDVAEVRSRRIQGLLRADELVVSRSDLQAVDSRGRASAIPDGVRRSGADQRIQMSFFDKNWRRGRIGDELRRRDLITDQPSANE